MNKRVRRFFAVLSLLVACAALAITASANRFVFASEFVYRHKSIRLYHQPELPSGLCCNDGQGGGQVCAGDQSVRHSRICVSERHRRRHLQSGCERAQQQLSYEPRAAHLPRVMHVL